MAAFSSAKDCERGIDRDLLWLGNLVGIEWNEMEWNCMDASKETGVRVCFRNTCGKADNCRN